MRTKTLAISLLVPALLLSACGRLNDSGAGGGTGASGGTGGIGGTGTTGGAGISHPTADDDLILRMETGGGFVAPSFTLKSVPTFSLYGDGRAITEGPIPEIYPGPALPNLQVSRLTEPAIQAILQAASDAGLLGADASYPYPCIADAGTTTFTVVAEGATHTVSAYALGTDAGGACDHTDAEARAKLQGFASKLGDLESWLPAGSVGASQGYTPTELRVYVQPYQPDPQLQETPVDWPLSEPLATFGEPNSNMTDSRCGVVSGDDFATLYPLAASANELTPWRSEGTSYGLIFRPLLPDEHTC